MTLETDLRDMWTKAGVPVDQQDRLIQQIAAKAAPGAKVGPFQIPHDVKGAAQRRAASRLLAPKPQQACDLGLFSDERDQLDLVDLSRRATR
jgi:hypothetical protein